MSPFLRKGDPQVCMQLEVINADESTSYTYMKIE
jgi:hypothetical protein